jgi:hypothetical protein
MNHAIMLQHVITRSYSSSESVNFYPLIQCIFNEIQKIIYGYGADMPRFRQLAASLQRVFRYLSARCCPFLYLVGVLQGLPW